MPPIAEFTLFDTSIIALGNQKYDTPIPDAFVNLDMGQMALSRQGRTSIYSGGFAGCLGVVIIPQTDNHALKGGAISHIHQMWPNRGEGEGYFLTAMSNCVDEACVRWGVVSVGLVLFRGGNTDSGGALYPELVTRVYRNPKVYKVVDSRMRRGIEGDQVLYDTGRQRVYIYGGAFTRGLVDRIQEGTEGRESTSTVSLAHSRRASMICNIYP